MSVLSAFAEFEIVVDGQSTLARKNDTVAVALWNAGMSRLKTSVGGQPRGWLCAMGSCYECMVMVDGQPRRACITPCKPGMKISRSPSENDEKNERS